MRSTHHKEEEMFWEKWEIRHFVKAMFLKYTAPLQSAVSHFVQRETSSC